MTRITPKATSSKPKRVILDKVIAIVQEQILHETIICEQAARAGVKTSRPPYLEFFRYKMFPTNYKLQTTVHTVYS